MSLVKIADPDKPGDYLVIAARDFDPARDQLFEPTPALVAAAPAKTGSIVDVNVEGAKALIAAASEMDTLDQLAVQEAANPKGPRASVNAAIQARRTAIANPQA